jgi:hypothetical protein
VSGSSWKKLRKLKVETAPPDLVVMRPMELTI